MTSLDGPRVGPCLHFGCETVQSGLMLTYRCLPRHGNLPNNFLNKIKNGTTAGIQPGSFWQGDAFRNRWRVAHALLGRGRVGLM